MFVITQPRTVYTKHSVEIKLNFMIVKNMPFFVAISFNNSTAATDNEGNSNTNNNNGYDDDDDDDDDGDDDDK